MSILKMELSIKQSNKFVDWYIDRYGKKDENGNLITPIEIPKIHTSKQKEEILEWARIIKEIL